MFIARIDLRKSSVTEHDGALYYCVAKATAKVINCALKIFRPCSLLVISKHVELFRRVLWYQSTAVHTYAPQRQCPCVSLPEQLQGIFRDVTCQTRWPIDLTLASEPPQIGSADADGDVLRSKSL